MKEREEHIVHVVNAHLRDIWIAGVRTLRAYKDVAELGQEILNNKKRIKKYIKWDRSPKGASPKGFWYRYEFYIPRETIHEKRTKWGELLLDRGKKWECSKHINDIINLKTTISTYHEVCSREWERAIRDRIEVIGAQGEAQTILDFSKKLLSWPGIKNASKEVKKRTQQIISLKNQKLRNLPIQLRVIEGISVEDIAEEAKKVIVNIKLARDWLDETTKDRKLWTR